MTYILPVYLITALQDFLCPCFSHLLQLNLSSRPWRILNQKKGIFKMRFSRNFAVTIIVMFIGCLHPVCGDVDFTQWHPPAPGDGRTTTQNLPITSAILTGPY